MTDTRKIEETLKKAEELQKLIEEHYAAAPSYEPAPAWQSFCPILPANYTTYALPEVQ